MGRRIQVTANRRIWPAAAYVLFALFIVFGWIVLSGALWPDKWPWFTCCLLNANDWMTAGWLWLNPAKFQSVVVLLQVPDRSAWKPQSTGIHRNQPESTGINRNQPLNLRNQLPENRNQPESTGINHLTSEINCLKTAINLHTTTRITEATKL